MILTLSSCRQIQAPAADMSAALETLTSVENIDGIATVITKDLTVVCHVSTREELLEVAEKAVTPSTLKRRGRVLARSVQT